MLRYRFLVPGEIIQKGDEYTDNAELRWNNVRHSIGRVVRPENVFTLRTLRPFDLPEDAALHLSLTHPYSETYDHE